MKDQTGFKELLNSMMKRRWYITAIVLGGFMLIIGGIFSAIITKNEIGGEWKELLLLLLGAFIGSYGKIVDYWFSDTDKDKMLVQKMDEEDGTALSNTADMPVTPPVEPTPIELPVTNTEEPKEAFKPIEVDEDGDGTMDGLDTDGDGDIDEYFGWDIEADFRRYSDNDGDEECLKCGKIIDEDAEQVGLCIY